MFLPNNYKDLEAETGRITDIFRIQNNLYIHTEEGLWHCPQTFQERVTSDIISFIGTGEYFSVPPRKIVDDANSSAGNAHKWARTKTKFGVLFPSWKEKKWYLFDGQQLKPISDNGNGNYFKTHMDFKIEQQYYSVNRDNYLYRNNPSNPIGVGFLSTYDTNKERLIVTKKDIQITNLPTTPYEICTKGKEVYLFTNMAQIISTRASLGWNYKGIEDCKMKFEKKLSSLETLIEYELGTLFVPQILNNSYTMSYSLKREEWVGWHPYLPSFYFHVQEKFYSWPQDSTYIYKHNRPNHYQTFYGVRYPFIVEYVDNPSAIATKVWDSIMFQTEAKKFDTTSEEYLDQREVTFNKILFYNTQQTSGVLDMKVKQNESSSYLLNQTKNTLGEVIIDRNERDWTMNTLRDIRVDYAVPMFLKDLPSLQSNYYIDKVVNPSAISYSKDWTQLESFRDKFLVVRLIFDNFADTRLIFNFSSLNKTQSER